METNKQINLMYPGGITSTLSESRLPTSVLDHPRTDMQSCMCYIAGLFKMRIRDLRIPNNTLTNPSVTMTVCKEFESCNTEHFTASNRVEFNGNLTKNATSSEIYLEKMPIHAVMVWIQISKGGKLTSQR